MAWFDRSKLRLNQLKIRSDAFFLQNSNSTLTPKMFRDLCFCPRYIRQTLATFWRLFILLFCVNLLWDLAELSFTQSLGFSRRRCYLHLNDQLSCCHWSLKKNKCGSLYLVVNPRKKESMDSKLAHGRVNKFYWWVAVRSRAWGLVSLIVWTSILSR